MKKNLFLGICAITLVVCPLAFAQPNVAGSVEIEEFEATESAQTKGRNDVVSLFEKLHDQLSSGKSPDAPRFDDAMARYVAAVYLQCSIKIGTCPQILDAILESDVVLSKLTGQVQCGNLKRAWAAWVNADMEKRVGLSAQVGVMQKATQFNQTERQKYIHCEQTVAPLLSESLQNRYSAGSEALKHLEFGRKYFQEVSKRYPNLYSVLGLDSK